MLIKAWTLGDKLGCLIFCDCAMIYLINLHHTVQLHTPTIHLVYHKSAPDSKLREWIVDQFLYDASIGVYNGLEYKTRAEELKDCEDWGFDISRR